ncbi:MAG TPA: acetyl-CoA carboxylase biotin carboxylase subunit [Pseudomonadota bacterium]|nr:acetyl-CoA carboxylase biotin carboxylase subunit [Pseudomonadota bacterium]
MQRFKKILIANRGEIALRVIRAARELGLRTVAVHSTADESALHVKFADESVCIGPPAAKQSYLHIPAIISAAEITGADAIHPGYGLLSENAGFAEVCERAGLVFIGPRPEHMRLMGDKVEARTTMAAYGLPVLPGTGILRSDEEALAAVDEIGLPVIIKATAGGGGRGMKIVHQRDRLLSQLHTARAEALAGFGNDGVFIERYVDAPRHIEVQVIGDGQGTVIALGERECSIQRRHQKLVEEAPSPALSPEERSALLDLVSRAISSVSYRSVGTLEFLFERQADGTPRFYFMEMNPRIQVEHTVTEMVSGVDLVRQQILLAQGEPLPVEYLRQRTRPQGHAIEVRINAEDPVTFAPSPGRITALHLPGGLGVRLDTHIYQGYVVPANYDSLLAKLIVHGEDRVAAVARLRRALYECVVEGIKTNIDFHRRICEHEDFLRARLDTRFVERILH